MKPVHNLSPDEQIFQRRIADLALLCETHHKPKFSAFLNEREQIIAEQAATKINLNWRFFGGEGNLEPTRKMLGFCEEYDDFPISVLSFSYRKQDLLSHRDFLGSLMSLGIKRETIGDIYTGEGYGIVYCANAVAATILDGVSKIGRVGVSGKSGLLYPIPQGRFEEVSGVVSSLRLDSVVSVATGLSREKAQSLIKSGAVMHNYFDTDNVSCDVEFGDKITIRGFGKFFVKDIGELTKKNRIHINLNKYI